MNKTQSPHVPVEATVTWADGTERQVEAELLKRQTQEITQGEVDTTSVKGIISIIFQKVRDICAGMTTGKVPSADIGDGVGKRKKYYSFLEL